MPVKEGARCEAGGIALHLLDHAGEVPQPCRRTAPLQIGEDAALQTRHFTFGVEVIRGLVARVTQLRSPYQAAVAVQARLLLQFERVVFESQIVAHS